MVFIDGANFIGGLKSIKANYSDFKFDFERFCEDITKGNILQSVFYYNASLKQELNPEPFKRQQRLFAKLQKNPKWRVTLCKRQRRVDTQGKEYHTIKGDDIHLAIDMLSQAYEDGFDQAILISGDGDYKPLIDYVKKRGKKVFCYYFKDNISLDLLQTCTGGFVIDKKTVNKYFLRKVVTLGDYIK